MGEAGASAMPVSPLALTVMLATLHLQLASRRSGIVMSRGGRDQHLV